ncbi:pyridoxamine 5'-phosphate oxidase family protein [Corynebacterium argentoratense]|uniref:pyridoxamine 5'-phosphate oxidase family protein n=1 Tax=Corynebacterium argentoratense TaxID=42817 RepID=UPI0028D43E60|nr:pyridoxamine 5'-phosphate oxidase family protein [Corynebacterium argentoratense]
MSDNEVFTQLSTEAALELMGTEQLGRVVVRRSDDMDIFPVNFVVDGGAIYFRTSEGNKLFSLSLNNDVLFEADQVDLDNHDAWSVIVKGTAEVLQDAAAIHHADSLDLTPWLPTLKYNYVKVTPNSVSGRKFHLGEEPQRY